MTAAGSLGRLWFLTRDSSNSFCYICPTSGNAGSLKPFLKAMAHVEVPRLDHWAPWRKTCQPCTHILPHP